MGQENGVLDIYREKVKKYNQIVTLFMLTYNRSEYLKLAIESVLNQTYTNFSLIILDNMSTDNTSEVVSNIKDDRLLYIKRSSGEYPNNELFAFDVNITPYLVVFHDDDIIEKEYLETMLNIIESNEDYSLVACANNTIDSKGNITAKFKQKNEYSIYSGNKYLEHFLCGNFGDDYSIMYPTVLYRYSFFKNKKYIYNTEFGPAHYQYYMFDCERRGGTMFVLGKPLLNYRVHANQDSSINRANMDFKLINAMYKDPYYKDFMDKMDKKNIYKFVRNSLKTSVKSYIKDATNYEGIKNTYSLINKEVFNDDESKKFIKRYEQFIEHPKTYSFFFKLRYFRMLYLNK